MAANTSQAARLPLQVRIHGSWRDPVFELNSKLPDWYVALVNTDVQQKLEAKTGKASGEVQQQFEQRAIQLQSSMERELQNAIGIVKLNANQLNVARNGIERKLKDITGESFTASRDSLSEGLR